MFLNGLWRVGRRPHHRDPQFTRSFKINVVKSGTPQGDERYPAGFECLKNVPVQGIVDEGADNCGVLSQLCRLGAQSSFEKPQFVCVANCPIGRSEKLAAYGLLLNTATFIDVHLRSPDSVLIMPITVPSATELQQ